MIGFNPEKQKELVMTDKQIINDGQGCHKCIHSKMNRMNLICTEWQEVIEDDKCLCSCYEEKSDE